MPNLETSPRYPAATFTDPTPYGYLYAGFTIDPPQRTPVVRPSKSRDRAISRLRAAARHLDGLPTVVKATLFRATFIPPVSGVPRFDVILLVRTTSPDVIDEVRTAEPYSGLDADLVRSASNARRIGVTEPWALDVAGGTGAADGWFPSASYLFNHFPAASPDRAIAAWESLTGWYLAKTGVDNSTLLRPRDADPYAIINYVRLPARPPRFLLNQLLRPSFTTFVRATLREHGMTALPVFARPVSDAA